MITKGEQMTDRAHGIDISKYQTTFDPAINPPRPLDFIVQRSSYGLKTDELFYQLLPGVAKVPRRLWYHYYNTGVDVKTQVDYTVNVIKNCGFKFHGFWGDYETAYNNLNSNSAKDIIYMVNEVEQRCGLPAFLYTNPNIWNTYLEPFGTGHRSLKLAVAQYFYWPNPFTKNPTLPKNAVDWKFWQYGITGKYLDTQNGKDYGSGNSALDLDCFNGDTDKLDEVLKITSQPETPPCQPIDITAELEAIKSAVASIEQKVV